LYLTATSRIHELTPEERAIYATLTPARLPEHVAIIMDGNGRWAGARSLKRFLGHQQAPKAFRWSPRPPPASACPGSPSTHFLSKTTSAARARSQLPHAFAQELPGEQLQRMMDNNVRMRYIGRTHELPPEVQDKMQWAAEATARNTGTTLTLALNYGAGPRWSTPSAPWPRR
jgi:undecaprenyl diphosphate synthase